MQRLTESQNFQKADALVDGKGRVFESKNFVPQEARSAQRPVADNVTCRLNVASSVGSIAELHRLKYQSQLLE